MSPSTISCALPCTIPSPQPPFTSSSLFTVWSIHFCSSTKANSLSKIWWNEHRIQMETMYYLHKTWHKCELMTHELMRWFALFILFPASFFKIFCRKEETLQQVNISLRPPCTGPKKILISISYHVDVFWMFSLDDMNYVVQGSQYLVVMIFMFWAIPHSNKGSVENLNTKWIFKKLGYWTVTFQKGWY